MQVWCDLSRSLLVAEHSERPFSTLETRSRISSCQPHASRRDWEFPPFSLMLRDEIENFCLSVSCFETRMRIWSYNLMFRDESEIFSHQSRASRREREFLLSVSCIETRTRIFTFSLILRDENFCLNSCTSRREREQCWGMASLIFSPFNNWKEFRWMNLINTCRNISLHSEEILFNWQQEILYRFAIDWRCPFLDKWINEMLSFYFSNFFYSQSQGSRREREFSSLNLRVRDENKIFSQHLRARDKSEIFFSTSQGSRQERDFFSQHLRVRDESEIFSFKVSCFEMGTRYGN